jgi:3,8-divinyl chlorophyllide a/chlorophyllide a reductase subunit Z
MLEQLVEQQPVLIRISVAKRLRDRAEREARAANASEVASAHVLRARDALVEGVTA